MRTESLAFVGGIVVGFILGFMLFYVIVIAFDRIRVDVVDDLDYSEVKNYVVVVDDVRFVCMNRPEIIKDNAVRLLGCNGYDTVYIIRSYEALSVEAYHE